MLGRLDRPDPSSSHGKLKSGTYMISSIFVRVVKLKMRTEFAESGNDHEPPDATLNLVFVNGPGGSMRDKDRV